MSHRVIRLTALVFVAAVALACGGDGPADDSGAAETRGEGTVAYPISITNCGTDVTVDAAPERVLILGRPDLYQILYDLGVADTIVARAGLFPSEYYDADAGATIEAVPSLGDDVDETGHLQLSQEAIIGTDPDLVVGLPEGLDQAGLAAEGIPVLRQPANCPEGAGDASFDDIYDLVETYGRIFDRPQRAGDVVEDLQTRIGSVEDAAADVGAGRSVAVLYPTVGGGTTYAYGNLSLSHELVTTAGFTNVFADVAERVFEVTTEELISRNPDALILLYSVGDPDDVVDAVRDLPGAGAITALRDDAVLPLLFSFGEFASPLVIDGLEHIADSFGAAP